jgi:PAS domain S-box-containing protein
MAKYDLRLLLIEDNEQDAYLARNLLQEGATVPFELIREARLATGLARLLEARFDLVLLDLSLPDSRGLATLQSVLEHSAATPVVVLTSLADESMSIQAVHQGAQDYLIKWPSDLRLLWRLLQHAIERAATRAALQASEERFRTLVQNSSDILTLLDREGTILYESPSIQNILGYTPEMLPGKNALDLVHPEDQFLMMQLLAQQAGSGTIPPSVEVRFRHADGSWRWLEATGSNLLHHPAIQAIAVNSRDITERKAAEERARFLGEAGELLAASLDYRTTLQQVANLAIASAADWCLVSIPDSDGTLQHVAFAHQASSQVELARELAQRYAHEPDHLSLMRQVLESRESLFVPEVKEQMLNGGNSDAARLTVLYGPGMENASSLLMVPLVARGRGLGVITLIMTESRRRYGPQDLRLAEELARRAALALDNARLYQAETQLREEAERSAARTSRLQRVTVALANASTREQVSELIIAEGVAALNADAGVLVLLNADTGELEVSGSAGDTPQVVEPGQSFPAGPPFPMALSLPIAEAMRTGQAVWYESKDALRDSYPQLAGSTPARNQALVSLPLLVDERAVGALGLSFAQPQAFSMEDRAMMQSLVQQCAMTLERTRVVAAMRVHRERAEALARQVIVSQEQERQRLSRELHDEAGQALTALKISLELLGADLLPACAGLRHPLNDAIALTDNTLEQLRLLAHDLRPPALDTVGLDATLEGYCQGFSHRTQIMAEYRGQEMREVPDAVAIALYRFLQEALTNAARHAHATHVQVRLEGTGTGLSLSVEDNGRGFHMPNGARGPLPSKGIGLVGMHERLALLGGTLAIHSRPDEGTRLVATVPFKEEP